MGKVLRAVTAVGTFGASEALGLGEAVEGKKKKVSSRGAVSELQSEADKTAKQRQALFATEGGILGEEVESVGKKKRGTILGN